MIKRKHLDRELISHLADLLKENGLAELEIERFGTRVRVSLGGGSGPVVVSSGAGGTMAASEQQNAAAQANGPENHENNPNAVKSPMVGTVYMAPEPGAAPFIQVGDKISMGQTLLIVEAMKVMNPIPAPKGGTVKEILIQDSQPIEFGDPLLIIE